MYTYLCEFEKKREREIDRYKFMHVYVCLYVCVGEGEEWVFVCESVCVCVYGCEYMFGCVSVYVCMCVCGFRFLSICMLLCLSM